MLKDFTLNSKLDNINININNSSVQVSDKAVTDCNNILHSYSICSNDLNIENKSIFDNSNFNNEISSLNYTLLNPQLYEETAEQNIYEEKINQNRLLIKPKENQKGNKERCEINYDPKKKEQSKQNTLGRKRKNDDSKGNHTKYTEDNIERRIKHLILKYSLKFINQKIKLIYNENIGDGIFKKELLPIHQGIKSNNSAKFNISLLNKTLGEIFSENISNKYTSYFQNHNRVIIKKLLDDKDEKIVYYFKKLFNITFSQCMDKFKGNNEVKELEGFLTFNDIKNELPEEPEYIEAFQLYLTNYENKLKKKLEKSKSKMTKKIATKKEEKSI